MMSCRAAIQTFASKIFPKQMKTFWEEDSLIVCFLTATRPILSAIDMEDSIDDVSNSQNSALDEYELNRLEAGSMPDSTKRAACYRVRVFTEWLDKRS